MNFYIIRGESWDGKPWHCRSSDRDGLLFDVRNEDVGFRVCCPSKGDGHTIQLEEQADG